MPVEVDAFIAGEADRYTERNAAHNAQYRIDDDRVARLVEKFCDAPRTIVDFGCSTGERLSAMCDRYRALGAGVDASAKAIQTAEARDPHSFWYVNDWTQPLFDGYDLAITSYVWHWVSPEVLLRAMYAVHGAVKVGGYLVINDWNYHQDVPYRHLPGLVTRKRSYQAMFAATGLFEEVVREDYYYQDTAEPAICVVLKRIA